VQEEALVLFIDYINHVIQALESFQFGLVFIINVEKSG
jgi:hypothetical protein